MASPETTRRTYDRLAAVYDAWWTGYVRRSLTLLLDRLDGPPGCQLLDVGCGTGELERRLLRKHPDWHLTGIDLSGEMLEVARRKLRNQQQVTLEQADAASLPFADDAFDRVVSASVMHYFSDPKAALHEMRRVVRPGGKILVLDWCRDFFSMKLLDALLRWIDPAHHRCYTTREMRRLFEQAGLSVVRITTHRISWLWGLMLVEVESPQST